MTMPQAAGPTTEEIWNVPLFNVTARANCLRGTRLVMNAALAGQRKVRAAPMTTRQT